MEVVDPNGAVDVLQNQQQQQLSSSSAGLKGKGKQSYTFDQISYDYYKEFIQSTDQKVNFLLAVSNDEEAKDPGKTKAQLKEQNERKKKAFHDKQEQLKSAEDHFFGLYFIKYFVIIILFVVCLFV
jgi:hypothetical protein